MKTNDNFPLISKELVNAIEECFPQRDFGSQTDHNILVFHYGKRSVVNFLRSKYNEQNENILNKNS